MTDTKKNIFKGVGVFLATVFVFVCACAIAFWFYLRQHPELLPQTAIISYVGSITDNDGEERSFIEIQHFEDESGNGVEMYELILTGYTDFEKSGVISKGVQFVETEGANDGLTNFKKYYYDRQKDLSWQSVEVLDRDTLLWVEIAGEMYAVSLDGKKSGTYEEYTVGSVLNGIGGWFRSWFTKEDVKFTETKTWTTYKDLDDMFIEMCSKLSTSNVKQGSYTMSLVDLANFFKLQRYDEDKKSLVSCDKQTFQSEYFKTKVNVYTDGVKVATQSYFDIIANDNEWVSESINAEKEDYSKVEVYPTLLASDFDWNFYKSYTLASSNGINVTLQNVFIPTIKEEVLTSLKAEKTSAVKIDFQNLEYFSEEIKGINGEVCLLLFEKDFEDIEIYSISKIHNVNVEVVK